MAFSPNLLGRSWRRAALAVVSATWIGLAPEVTAQNPYQAGLRWSASAQTAQPWIARRVAFAGDAQAIWAGRAVAFPGVTLYVGTDSGSLAAALDVPMPGALGPVEVAVGRSLDELYCAAQYSATGGKQTIVSRYSALASSKGSSPDVWTTSLGAPHNGGVLLAVAPTGIWVARLDANAGVVHLSGLDPMTGVVGWTQLLAGAALRGLQTSADGTRIALALGNRVSVWSAAGVELASLNQTQSNEAFALSADGTTLAVGGLGHVKVWRDEGAGYVSVGQVELGAPWLATRAVLSADGQVLGAGFWNSATADAIRWTMWNLGASTKLHDVTQTGVYGGLQNFPEAIAINASGKRLLCGAWGSGGPHPQLMLLDRDQPEPVYSTYTPGSVLAVDLSADGTQLAVAVKSGHSNQFSTTGFVQRFDTGERDVQLIGTLQTGQAFQITSMRPQSFATVFALGSKLSPTSSYPGVEGALAIQPTKPYWLFMVPASPAGRADLIGAVPPIPSFVGLTLSAQAVFVEPNGLAFSWASPTLCVL